MYVSTLYFNMQRCWFILQLLCNYCETIDEVVHDPVMRRPSIAPSFTDSDKFDRLSVGDELQSKSAQSTPQLVCMQLYVIYHVHRVYTYKSNTCAWLWPYSRTTHILQ